MNGERQSVEAEYVWGWLALFLLGGFERQQVAATIMTAKSSRRTAQSALARLRAEN
jgi:hypothetical protein